jgi:uncharacterized delta-60 repeat protein
VLWYNEDGSLDRGFGKRGRAVNRIGSASEDAARAVAIQQDGKILVAGKAHIRYDSDMVIVRYKPDGKIDSDFGLKGKIIRQFGKYEERIGSVVKSIAIQPDGKIVVGINPYKHGSHWKEGRLMRYNPDGTLDPSFGTGGMVTVNKRGYGIDALGSVALQADGRILFTGGDYENATSNYAIVVGRSNGDGSPDTTFGSNGFTRVMIGKLFAAGRKIAIQQDGKIIVAGDVGEVDPNAISHRSSRHPSDLVFFRLKTDGQIDKYFGSVPQKNNSLSKLYR